MYNADAVQGLYYKVTRWILLLFGVSCYFRTTFWYVPKSVMIIYKFNIDQLSYMFRGWNKQCLGYTKYSISHQLYIPLLLQCLFACPRWHCYYQRFLMDALLVWPIEFQSMSDESTKRLIVAYSSRNWIQVD